jgi:hypothetical protein
MQNSWEYVFVYDIAGDRWYNQTTTGKVASRTEFCAVVQHDPSSVTYEVYVLGGADYASKEVLSDVYVNGTWSERSELISAGHIFPFHPSTGTKPRTSTSNE